MFEIAVESDKGRKKFINEIIDEFKSHNDSWRSINSQTTDNRINCYLKKVVPSEQDMVWLYYVNENILETCPQIQILIEHQPCRALIDTGWQCSIISEELYKGKAVPLQAWCNTEVSRKLRFPDFATTAQDGGKFERYNRYSE